MRYLNVFVAPGVLGSACRAHASRAYATAAEALAATNVSPEHGFTFLATLDLASGQFVRSKVMLERSVDGEPDAGYSVVEVPTDAGADARADGVAHSKGLEVLNADMSREVAEGDYLQWAECSGRYTVGRAVLLLDPVGRPIYGTSAPVAPSGAAPANLPVLNSPT